MPPTDNLYKFIFISGILIYLYSLTFAVQQFRENWELNRKYKKETILINDLIKKDSLKIELLNYQFNIDGKCFLKELDIVSLDTLKLDNEQLQIFKEYIFLKTNKTKNDTLLKVIKDRATEPILFETGARHVFFFLFFLGIFLIPFGFYYWYTKLHVPNMILLENQVSKVLGEDAKQNRTIGKGIWSYTFHVIAFLLFFIPIFIFFHSVNKYKESINENKTEIHDTNTK